MSIRKIQSCDVRCFDCGWPLYRSPELVTNSITYEAAAELVLTDDPSRIALLETECAATQEQVTTWFAYKSCWSAIFDDGKVRTFAELLLVLREAFNQGELTNEIFHPPPAATD